MRLIRLTSNSSDGIIDNNFQAEILIKENSQIALDSLTTEISPFEIVIDTTNDEITFTIEVGKSLADKTITLTHGTYGGESASAFTYQQLLDEIELLMTKSLSTFRETGTGKMLGSEYQVYYNSQGKTEIAVAQAPNTAIQSSNTGTWVLENISISANGQVVKRGAEGDAGELNSYMYQPIRLARGGGCVRVRVGTSTAGGDESDAGFIVGVSRSNPASWVGGLADNIESIAWGAQFINAATDYDLIEDGVNATSGVTPSAVGTFGDNDILQIGQYYDDSDKTTAFYVGVIQSDGTFEAISDPIDVTATDTYFAVIAMIGSNDASDAGACSVGAIRSYTDPYDQRTNAVSPNATGLSDTLGANVALTYEGGEVQIYYNFKDNSLRNYLGFININSGNLGYRTLRSYISYYSAYASSEAVDNFIFELLNLDVNSYDGLSQQRKNYLSTIPSTANIENIVSYKTSYPIFLNLSNKKPFTLRNLQARLLTFGGSVLSIRGQTTATILIKDGDDK